MSQSLLGEDAARKNVNYLASLDFIVSLGFGLIMPLFPVYVDLLGGGGLEVGILFSSFVFTRALLAAPFGNLSDRLGRKNIILVGSVMYAVLALLFTVPDTWFGLIFVRAGQGVASAMVWPVSEALVIDSTPAHKRGASMGKIVMASNLGFVVGPFVGGALFIFASQSLGYAESDAYKFPFYFTAALALVGSVLTWLYVTDAKAPEKTRTALSLKGLFSPPGVPPERLRTLRILYLNASIEGFSFASIGPLMVLFLGFRFELDAGTISILIGVSMGLGALIAFPSGRIADRVGRKVLFVVGGYVAFTAIFFIPFFYSLLLVILLLAARSMAFQVSSPALRALQADIVPEHVRGRLIGLLESMMNMGSVVGAPLGGFLWDQFHGRDFGLPLGIDGTVVPFVISGIMGITTVMMVHLTVKEAKRVKAGEEELPNPPDDCM
ncbi:MAG: transporter [Candidatus Thermoplasmatota archaeon]|nr:transporter [Candidatus Thermoplasmatota archaeon]